MNRKSILWPLLIVLFFKSLVGLAQSSAADSLQTRLAQSQGEERLEILVELSFVLREIEQKQALEHGFEAEQLAEQFQDMLALSKAKENISWIYYRMGHWQKAFDYAEEAYQISLNSQDSSGAARVLNNMGALYYEQQNYEMAVRNFRKAFEISSNSDDLYTQIRSLNNLAFNHTMLGNLDSAMFFAKKAIQVNENAGSPYLTSFSNRVIGDVYFARNQLDSAELIYEKSLELARMQGLNSFLASIFHRLGRTYLQDGKLREAKKILEEGVALSKEHHYRDELAKSHKYLAQVYEQEGNIGKAFESQSAYLAINDSLVDQANKDRLALMQGMFEDNLEKSELELLKAQNDNQANRLAFINKVVLIISIGALLIFALLLWLARLNRNFDKINKELTQQQEMIQEQNSQLEAKSQQLEEINRTKNKLFSILGHDLRGPVGQVKNIVDLALSNHLDQEEFDELLRAMKQDLDNVHFTLTNTLKWSSSQMEGFSLRPTELDLKEVVTSVLQLLNPRVLLKKLQVRVEMPDGLILLLDRDLIEVVVRNILSNAIKYSPEGKTIFISLKEKENTLEWCVKDQGMGMTPQQIEQILAKDYLISNSRPGTNNEKGSGLGLQVCKEFIQMSQGELKIDSEVGQGAKFCVSFPIRIVVTRLNPVNS